MKLTHLLVFAALLSVAACGPSAPPPADTSAEDAAAVCSQVDRFVEAWNAGDTAAIGPMIADDAVLMQPDEPIVTGREAILEAIAGAYDPAAVEQSATCDEVIPLGEYAYARGTWNLAPTEAAEPELEASSGKWTVLYRRGAEGGWQMARWMWNEYGE